MKLWQHLAIERCVEYVPEELHGNMFNEMFQFLIQLRLEVNEMHQAEIRRHCDVVRFKKGTVIVDYPDVRDHVIFVAKGLICIEYWETGCAFPRSFLQGGDVLMPFDFSRRHGVAGERFVALEETDCITASRGDIDALVSRHPALGSLTSRLSEVQLVRLCDWRYGAYYKAPEKWDWLCEEFPSISERIPDDWLASFLGVEIDELPDIKRYARLRNNVRKKRRR
jgi:hypothetical protein